MIRKNSFIIILCCAAQVILAQRVLLDNGYYRVVYDDSLGIPIRAEWTIEKRYLGREKRDASWAFREDTRLPKPRVTSKCYNGTGFDRGHLCPSADWTASRPLMKGTFLMSNICPQTPECNRRYWLATEVECRALAKRYGWCQVVAAPICYSTAVSNTLTQDACITFRRTIKKKNERVAARGSITIPEWFFKCAYDSINHRFCKWWCINNRIWQQEESETTTH